MRLILANAVLMLILILLTEAPSTSPQAMVDQAEVDLPNIMLSPMNKESHTATPTIPTVVERVESFPLLSPNIIMKVKKVRKVANTPKKKRRKTTKKITLKKKKTTKRKKIPLTIVIALIFTALPLNSTVSQALVRIVHAITPQPLMTPVLAVHKLPLQATSTLPALMVSPLVELK